MTKRILYLNEQMLYQGVYACQAFFVFLFNFVLICKWIMLLQITEAQIENQEIIGFYESIFDYIRFHMIQSRCKENRQWIGKEKVK